MKEPRNMLIESSRIARGNIKDLKDLKAENFDAFRAEMDVKRKPVTKHGL